MSQALASLLLPATELRTRYAALELSPVEVVEANLARIAEAEPIVNAFTSRCEARARKEAVAAERAYREGRARPLEGITLGVKDFFDSEGVRTTYGSAMFAEHVPERDATALRLARAAGAIVVGKTATHEWAWGITTVNPHFGPTRNPWQRELIAGGSSGGSAVALACGECALALGSDTGGSIRIPAAFCGIVGLKPTFGRVSGAGAMSLARSMDHPGPMARTPRDAALLLQAIAGADPEDAATRAVALGDLAAALDGPVAGIRVGRLATPSQVGLTPDVAAVLDDVAAVLAQRGAQVIEVEVDGYAEAFETFGVIQRAEALHAHRERGLYPARRAEYGADVLGRLELAESVTLDDYLRASEARRRLCAGFDRAFTQVDLLLTPVSAGPPARVGEEEVGHRGRRITFRELVMPATVPQDLAGLPACALRGGFDRHGLPVGVQVTGPAWSEAAVLGLAEAIAAAMPDVQNRWPEIDATPDPEAST